MASATQWFPKARLVSVCRSPPHTVSRTSTGQWTHLLLSARSSGSLDKILPTKDLQFFAVLTPRGSRNQTEVIKTVLSHTKFEKSGLNNVRENFYIKMFVVSGNASVTSLEYTSQSDLALHYTRHFTTMQSLNLFE